MSSWNSFGLKEKSIILNHTMCCCLFLQIYLCNWKIWSDHIQKICHLHKPAHSSPYKGFIHGLCLISFHTRGLFSAELRWKRTHLHDCSFCMFYLSWSNIFSCKFLINCSMQNVCESDLFGKNVHLQMCV